MSSATETGVVHGRFQPLNIAHMKYISAAKERCNHLVVGIANPDPSLTEFDSANPRRSLPSTNPFTYYERQLFVRRSLCEDGFLAEDFTVVPFPINRLELLHHYVPPEATFFMTIYDDWDKKKLGALRALGLHVEKLWEKGRDEKTVLGSEIRQRIADGDSWEHLVPSAVVEIIKERGLADRVRELLEGDDFGSEGPVEDE